MSTRMNTDWFRRLRNSVICFADGRLKFRGAVQSAPLPSMVVYLSRNRARISTAFCSLGDTGYDYHSLLPTGCEVEARPPTFQSGSGCTRSTT
jgi:hypothetical protein